jgi:cbb3-type cytochrome oxidase subunit 3
MNFETINIFSKQFSTVIFFFVFVIVMFNTYRPKNKVEIESIKYSIFDEDEQRRIK